MARTSTHQAAPESGAELTLGHSSDDWLARFPIAAAMTYSPPWSGRCFFELVDQPVPNRRMGLDTDASEIV